MSAPRLKLAQLKGFPELEEEKIVTEHFIEAANEIILVIEQFGTMFYPIVKDMRNNSTQLMAFYLKDIERRRFIEDMILYDESKATHPWLLWLKRALEMIERFFFHILNDNEIINQKSDNLQPMIVMAYTEVLEVVKKSITLIINLLINFISSHTMDFFFKRLSKCFIG